MQFGANFVALCVKWKITIPKKSVQSSSRRVFRNLNSYRARWLKMFSRSDSKCTGECVWEIVKFHSNESSCIITMWNRIKMCHWNTFLHGGVRSPPSPIMETFRCTGISALSMSNPLPHLAKSVFILLLSFLKGQRPISLSNLKIAMQLVNIYWWWRSIVESGSPVFISHSDIHLNNCLPSWSMFHKTFV